MHSYVKSTDVNYIAFQDCAGNEESFFDDNWMLGRKEYLKETLNFELSCLRVLDMQTDHGNTPPLVLTFKPTISYAVQLTFEEMDG